MPILINFPGIVSVCSCYKIRSIAKSVINKWELECVRIFLDYSPVKKEDISDIMHTDDKTQKHCGV